MTCEKHFGNDPQSPNPHIKFEHNPEIQKRGVYVRTYRDTPPVIAACTGTPIAYQI